MVEVKTNGKILEVHNTNTGRLEELLKPGRVALCYPLKNPKKLKYRIFAIKTDGGFAIIDTYLQEKVVEKYLKSCGYEILKKHPRINGMVYDYLVKKDGEKTIVEIKSAVLEKNGYGLYPDCPSDRGLKHIKNLAMESKNGNKTLLIFVVALPKAKGFKPYEKGDPRIAKALRTNQKHLTIKALHLTYSPENNCLKITEELPVVL